MDYPKGYIVDYKQLKANTKTVYILKRVYIPSKLFVQFNNVKSDLAAKAYLATIPVKTIFQACGSSSIIFDEIVELERKPVLYDVCNDYSLDICDKPDFDKSIYKFVIKHNGILYIHKQYNEIHYYSGKAGLNGLNLFSL